MTTPAPNLVISNYDSTPVGPYCGLEGSAYVARINDPSAAWFNPAGLTRQGAAQISGSAGVYQRTAVALQSLPGAGGSYQQLPNFVGFTFVPQPNLTVGAAFLSTNAWEQETDAELITTVPAGLHRLGYSADAEYEVRVAAVSAGYHRGGPWRFGGGLALSIMSLGMAQSVSDRIIDAATVRTLLVEAHASGSAYQIRAQGGVQYDLGERWRFGGAVRTPGAMVYKSGSVVLDGVFADGQGSSGASLFADDAELEYRLPWEFQGGGAWLTPRLELELNVQAYTPIDPYQLLSTDEPTVLYGDAAGQPPTITTRDANGMVSASKGVVNVSAGGHFRVLANRDFRVHAGLGANQSPVAPDDTVFTKVDLSTWSFGLSGTFGRLQFAAGINRHSGTADNVLLRNRVNGEQVRTPVDIRMVGFIYSLAYQF